MMLPARSARPFLTVRLCCRSMCSANSASLLHREVLEVDAAAAPKATCWIMHGILGSGRNLRTFGRRIARTYPGWEVSLIDHRGHGKSPSFNAPHTIEACVNDIQALAVACGKAPNVLIGHSVGGKVALAALDRGMIQGSDVPRHTFVLDALPGVVPPTTKFSSSMNVSGVVSALASLTPMMPAPSKAAALDGLRAAGMEEAVVSWMSTNLTHVQNKGYDWTFDLDVIVPLFSSARAADFRKLCARIAARKDGGPALHFVRAGRNPAWSSEVLRDFEHWTTGSGDSLLRLSTIRNAGHWVHVDAEDELFEIVSHAFES